MDLLTNSELWENLKIPTLLPVPLRDPHEQHVIFSRFCVLSILIQSLSRLSVITSPCTSHARTIKLCYVLAHFTLKYSEKKKIVWHYFIDIVVGTSYQVGKLNVSETRQGWKCNSGCEAPQHCTLPRCTNVVFPQTFSGSGTVSKPY